MIKYKFVQTTGCTAFDFSVNDESIVDISEEKQEEILDYLLIKLKERFKVKNIHLENIVEMFEYDDYEHFDHQSRPYYFVLLVCLIYLTIFELVEE